MNLMASAFSHILVAFALGQAQPWKRWPSRFWGLSLFCTLLPDVDVVGFAMGIPYEHVLGHRGVTHSLVFAVGMGLLVVRIGFPSVDHGSWEWWSLVTHFCLVTASHGILDALTDGGLGIAFFAPFDSSRYFFPWTPIKVSPIGISEFFTAYGMKVLVSELVWVGIPVGAGLIGIMFIRWRLKSKPS
ncbi:MAG: metal-dependent hydrolase [Nitrospirota bacterium]|nr:MAG: metal-dependent hydrolase [Nitrospirota bacterium]